MSFVFFMFNSLNFRVALTIYYRSSSSRLTRAGFSLGAHYLLSFVFITLRVRSLFSIVRLYHA